MALTRGSLGGYEFERMVVLCSMVDGERRIPRAVSTSAMDELEIPTTTKARSARSAIHQAARSGRRACR
jgi:hypothetical protein